MGKTAIVLADGFEEIEGLTVVDLLRRAGIEVDMISNMDELMIDGSHKIKVRAEVKFSEADFDNYDMIILPGGGRGTENLENNKALMAKLDEHYNAGKFIAAICAAPSIFGHRGYLEGRRATCYPGFEPHLIGATTVTENAVTDGNVITSRGMGTSVDFALAIITHFLGKDAADELAQKIVYLR